METCIYLDYNATTPIDQEVQEAMLPYLTSHFGNPSSGHIYGEKTNQAIENARLQVAHLIECSSSEIVFTSGGTESNNYVIQGFAFANESRGKHIITTAIEHPAVIEVVKYLEVRRGFRATYLSVDKYGTVNLQHLKESLTPETILVTIMHANNEVGTIQPLQEISSIIKSYNPNIAFHTDASQSVGKVPINVKNLGVDFLTIAGHKIYAPKGVGCLYIKNGLKLEKLIHGAGHERGLRAGTENTLLVVGLGHAAMICNRDFLKSTNQMKKMRDLLYQILTNEIEDIHLNGNLDNCLPNTLSLSFKGIKGTELIYKLKNQVAVSAGSACHSNSITLSATLQAMGVPFDEIVGTIRFSTGKYSTEEEIIKSAHIVVDAVKKLKKK